MKKRILVLKIRVRRMPYRKRRRKGERRIKGSIKLKTIQRNRSLPKRLNKMILKIMIDLDTILWPVTICTRTQTMTVKMRVSKSIRWEGIIRCILARYSSKDT